MTEQVRYMITLYTRQQRKNLIPLSEVARISGIHPELVEKFVSLGLLEPEEGFLGRDALFNPDSVRIIRKIIRLRHELGLNYAGIGVVLDLLEKINTLQNKIDDLEYQLQAISCINGNM